MLIRTGFLIFFGILIHSISYGQEVLVFENLRGDTVAAGKGMNRKHYRHPFIGFNMFLGGTDGPGGKVHSSGSFGLEYGLRYKRKFSHYYSVGYDISLRRLRYSPAEWQMASLNGELPLKSEKLVLVQTGLAFYQRINWQKKRGDFIGRFVDLGVYGIWNFASRYVYAFDLPTGEGVKVKESKLGYVQPFGYGALGRIAFGNFVIKTTYRFSDHFKKESGLDEFPRFTLGFELGLHPF